MVRTRIYFLQFVADSVIFNFDALTTYEGHPYGAATRLFLASMLVKETQP